MACPDPARPPVAPARIARTCRPAYGRREELDAEVTALVERHKVAFKLFYDNYTADVKRLSDNLTQSDIADHFKQAIAMRAFKAIDEIMDVDDG